MSLWTNIKESVFSVTPYFKDALGNSERFLAHIFVPFSSEEENPYWSESAIKGSVMKTAWNIFLGV